MYKRLIIQHTQQYVNQSEFGPGLLQNAENKLDNFEMRHTLTYWWRKSSSMACKDPLSEIFRFCLKGPFKIAFIRLNRGHHKNVLKGIKPVSKDT